MSRDEPVEVLHTPYNFVPLSAFVYQPEWGDRVSRDIPFSDGLNGVLDLTITAHTPILLGGRQTAGTENKVGETHPFEMPDGTPAIPGGSLKGMLRNVLSIASFGKMQAVDDKWLSIRDLTPGTARIYREKMGEKDLKPKVEAGYLRLIESNNEGWEIVPCKFLRVEHKSLIDWGKAEGILRPEKICGRQSAVDKYLHWGDHLDVSFRTIKKSYKQKADQRTGHVTPEHDKAHMLGHGDKQGLLVFTGQPVANIPGKARGKSKPKHMEFVFYNPGEPVPIEDQVLRAFLHIHGETPEWKFHQKRSKQHLGIPVFYLEHAGYPTHIGLAMMFRLAYTHSIAQAINHTSYLHRNGSSRDLADILLGYINDNDSGLAGRVSFGTAVLEGERRNCEPITTILNGPKPSYYPAYIEQKQKENGHLAGDQYATLMDDGVEIRGWKRYPAREEIGGFETDHQLGKKVSNKVKVKLHPLESDSVFKGRMRLHNVRPEELGALLWCLTWGGDPQLRHGMGMGKPFGLGQVSIEATLTAPLMRNDGNHMSELTDCLKAFETLMERVYGEAVAAHGMGSGTWRNSEQMVQLTAMANPACAPGLPGSNHYMPLKQFLNSKGRAKKDNSLVLFPYAKFEGHRDRELFPRWTKAQWLNFAEEQEAERKRAEALAAMSPLEREFRNQIEAPGGEARLNYWLEQMASRTPEEGRDIAGLLRNHFVATGKWDGKQSPKQKAKIQRIKKWLD